jgi:hypothetical protein
MARSVVAAALIAAVVIGAGMTAPAFAKQGEHGGDQGGWNHGSNPPGWSHGNKTGWGGHNMPPGLYKKFHSNSDHTYSNRYRGDYSYSNRYSRYSYPYSGSSNYYRNSWYHGY